ncbi:MAG: malate dehydrogenase [Planctomycetes bacterium]|nr:malate dehydrogenase [Planctomycetota bacterium]MCR4318230.1 malate dehydrogenase [Planctomycetota bacterium]
MQYLTNSKVAVLGAAGAIGSNLAQILLCTGTTSNVAMYDPFEKGLEGAAEEMFHCGFPNATVTFSTNVSDVLKDAEYIISSGGAPRKDGMTREDLLAGNCEIAKGLGEDIKKYCPNAKLAIIIFNPADITGLTTLVYSGLAKDRVLTLAALDSTRLRRNLSKHLGVATDEVTGCRTFGGHGEQMAVFGGGIKVKGKSLKEVISSGTLSEADWKKIKDDTCQGGKAIIQLRGRSSFQSPAQCSVDMLRARISGNHPFGWPAGTYVDQGEFKNIMMAVDTTITPEGVSYKIPQGDDADNAALRESYHHLVKLRDECIGSLKVLPSISEWNKFNPNL